MTLRIEFKDVIKILLQYCEVRLPQTFKELQNESQIFLNSVPSDFISKINSGEWLAIWHLLERLHLTNTTSLDLMEQIILEMIEIQNWNQVSILFGFKVMELMKNEQPDRFSRLQDLYSRTKSFDPNEAYGQTTKEKRRALIAQDIAEEVTEMSHERLEAMIDGALILEGNQWEHCIGTMFDLLHGTVVDPPTAIEDSFPHHANINWMQKGVLNDIQDQAKTDSCWCYSGVRVFEAALAIDGLPLEKYSEHELVDLVLTQSLCTVKGGHIFYVFEYLIHKGIRRAKDYPTGSHEHNVII